MSDLHLKNILWQHRKVQVGHGDQKPSDKFEEKATAVVQRKNGRPLNSGHEMTFECCDGYMGVPPRLHFKGGFFFSYQAWCL